MTTNVLKLSEFKPHLSGEAKCVKCGAEWGAVQPIPAINALECPECGLFYGYFKFPVGESEGSLVFSCNHCGGDIFNVLPEHVRCVNCGFKHDKYQ